MILAEVETIAGYQTRGKSGHLREALRLTAGCRKARDSSTETIPPRTLFIQMFGCEILQLNTLVVKVRGKGEKR